MILNISKYLDSNTLYVWGRNDSAQLGLGIVTLEKQLPMKLETKGIIPEGHEPLLLENTSGRGFHTLIISKNIHLKNPEIGINGNIFPLG